jgi:hypothetical protein
VKSGEVVLNVRIADGAKISVPKLFKMREFWAPEVIERVREMKKAPAGAWAQDSMG